jgi:hypothetical protein
MKAPRFVGSQAHAGYALGAVFVGAVALTALGSIVPEEALSALRALIPVETPFLGLVLLGWLGVALGWLTMRAEPTPAPRGGRATTRQDAVAREEKVDRILSPHRKGDSGPSDRQRKLFRATRRRQRAPGAAGNRWPDQGDRAGSHRGQSRHARQASQRQEPARRIAPPGRPVANKPRTGGRGRAARRGDRDRQPTLL